MVIKKKTIVTIVMMIIMFHLSFITIKEEYFPEYLKIQRIFAISLVSIVIVNIDKYLKRDNFLINFLTILLSISIGYSSYLNRNLSGYGWNSIFFAIIKVVAPFLALEYVYVQQEQDTAVKTLFICAITYCLISDIHGFVNGFIGQDKTNLLIGNKFQLSYLHIYAMSFYAYMCEQKNKHYDKFLFFLWVFSLYISMATKCTTAMIACIIFLFLLYTNKKFDKKPFFAITLLFFCDSLLLFFSNILSWKVVSNFIIYFLHEDITLTGRMTIYKNIFKLIEMSPWFGFGLENNYMMSHLVVNGGNTQNGLADIIVSYGIVGTSIILLIMIIAIKKQKENYSVSFMAIIYTLIIISMVEITLGKEFIIFLSLLAFIGKKAKSSCE